MSRGYMLICFDCKISISFGKVYWLDEQGKPLDSITCDGVFEMKNKRWHKRDEFFGRIIEKFFIAHRNHELRFVPEGVDEYLENKFGYIEDIDADDLINMEIVPEVDWWQEREEWKRRLEEENTKD